MPANKRPIAGEASSDDGTDDKNFDPATRHAPTPRLFHRRQILRNVASPTPHGKLGFAQLYEIPLL
jgi:hypothetical protein